MWSGVVFLALVISTGTVFGQRANRMFEPFDGDGLKMPDGSEFTQPLSRSAPVYNGPPAISFRRYVHHTPEKAKHNFEFALKALRNHERGEALDRLSDAVRIDPDYFEAHLRMGEIYIEASLPSEALASLEQAVRIDPNSQGAHALAGWALLMLERPAQAEVALRRSLQLGRSVPALEEMLSYAREQRFKVAAAIVLPPETAARPIP